MIWQLISGAPHFSDRQAFGAIDAVMFGESIAITKNVTRWWSIPWGSPPRSATSTIFARRTARSAVVERFTIDRWQSMSALVTVRTRHIQRAAHHDAACSSSRARSGDVCPENNGDFFKQNWFPQPEAQNADFDCRFR